MDKRQSNKILSVIVPVFNGEKYLSECLKALLNQGLAEQDYEVIVVNDGSTDETESIIDLFCKHSSIIKKVNKSNGGVSSARNMGIETSQSSYITFVDADDKIGDNVYSAIMQYVLKNNLDGFFFEKTRDEQTLVHDISIFDIEAKANICSSLEASGIGGVIYKNSILTEHKILFDTLMINAEDLLFNFYYAQRVHKVGNVLLPFYFYRTNDDSVTRRLFRNRTVYGDLTAREYRCYLSLLRFLTKLNENRIEYSQSLLCERLLSVMMREILWTGVRSFYNPITVLNDISSHGLSLTDIRFKYIEGDSFKQWVKNGIKCFLRYPVIFKGICFAWRHIKGKM